jgi:hypothetical protein
MIYMADTYKLVNYFDVWRDEEDGWQVNNLCHEEGEIVLNNYTSDNEIVVKLIDFGFLKTGTSPKDIVIWNEYEMIKLFDASNDLPLCRLELIRE